MSVLIKIVMPVASLLTTGGGIIGSNYIFTKTIQKELSQNGDNKKWENKLSKLLTKIEENENLKSKISTANGNLNVTSSGTSPKTFTNKSKATSDLKTWCQKKTKDTSEKTHEDKLCKESQQVGWLFGNKWE